MKKIESKRNGQLAEILKEDENNILIKLENGEEKKLSKSTIKRWWKMVEEIIPQSEETTQEKPARETKKEETKIEEAIIQSNQLKDFIIAEAIKRNCITFSGKVKALVSIKYNNVAALAFTFGKKGINLWLREVNCQGIVNDYKKTNHLFGARISLKEFTAENKELIIKLMEKSIEFVINK